MNKTRIGLLFYMAAGIAMFIGIGFLCIEEKLPIDTPSTVAWFAARLVGITIAVSFTIQYAIALYFNADGNYVPDEVEMNASLSGFATVVTVLLLIAARFYDRETLATYMFIVFEGAVFAYLFVYSWGPSVNKSGHASMYAHTAAVGTTPTTDEKNLPVGMIVLAIVALIVISQLATCGAGHETARNNGKKTGEVPPKDHPEKSLWPKPKTHQEPATAEEKPEEPRSIPPAGYDQSQTTATGAVTFEQYTTQASGDGSGGAMAN